MSPAWLLALALAQVLTRAPELIHDSPANYPRAAVSDGREATVLLELELDATGHVTEARVVDSGGAAFDDAALVAARGLIFRPAEVDGAPAAVRIQYRTTFRLAAAPVVAPRLRGQVRDRWSKRPLAGVQVEARLATGEVRTTSTSTAGTFALDALAPGPLTLRLGAPGYTPVHADELLVAGEETQANYLVEPLVEAVDDEEVVHAPRVHRAVAQVVMDTAAARRVPGTQGDTVKVLQTLPGVARPPLGSGALSVWGAAPEETRVLLDGVDLPALYHLGGVRSLLASELVERVTLTPAGQGARFGRGVGGVIEVESHRPDADGLHAALAIDVLDVGAWLVARPSPATTVAVAGRQSLLHALVPAFTDSDVGALFPLPNYRDVAVAADLALGPGEHLDVLALGAMDSIERATDAVSERTDQDVAFARVRWTREAGAGRSTVVPAVSWSRRARDIRDGDVTASEAVRALTLGVRAEHQRVIDDGLTLTFGVDGALVAAEVTRVGSLTIPAREGDPAIFGRAPSDAVNADTWTTTDVDVAPYASAELTLGPLTLTPGLRLDFLGQGVSRLTPKLGLTPQIGGARLQPRWGPRFAAAWAVLPGALTVRGAVGLYSQAPEPEAASSVFGNPQLDPASGAHATVAIEARPLDGVRVEVAGFVREASGLVARSTAPTPKLAEVLSDEGEGRALGAQALVGVDPPSSGDGAFGWASYTLLRAERRAQAELPWRRADFDRSHALSLVAGYLWSRWTLGARLRWSSGAPTTPVTGRYYDARRDRYVPVLGPAGDDTLPPFFQLDLRVERRFPIAPLDLDVSLEVQNVTAHANVEARAYSADYQQVREVTGLPFIAVLGVRVAL